jgi:hypothetical protein
LLVAESVDGGARYIKTPYSTRFSIPTTNRALRFKCIDVVDARRLSEVIS